MAAEKKKSAWKVIQAEPTDYGNVTSVWLDRGEGEGRIRILAFLETRSTLTGRPKFYRTYEDLRANRSIRFDG